MGTPSTTVVGVHPYASVRWSAIIGGWIVATGVATLMYVAGLAFGFSVFDPYNAAPSAKGVGIGTAIWIVLTWMVSLFLGGMFASWFDGKADQTVGTLHGVGVWGLAIADYFKIRLNNGITTGIPIAAAHPHAALLPDAAVAESLGGVSPVGVAGTGDA